MHVNKNEDFPFFYRCNTYANTKLDVDMYEWCEEQFGPFRPEIAPSGTFRWATTFNGYYFKEEKDYILTLLRWG